MKSSGPVFTKQNPFPPASTVRRRENYHPSVKQSLSKREKNITLSPARSCQQPIAQLHSLSQESQQPYKKHDRHFSAADGQPVFKEIWPSDCESSPEMEKTKKSARSETLTVSPGVQEDSVLAKYIDRFRHGQPQSREERQQTASASGDEQLPFWWISHSAASSSIPTERTDRDDHDYGSAGQHRHDRSFTGEFDDTEILHLQERANSILLRSERSPSDGSVPVSSEGLGSSDFSSSVSVDEPVRQPLIPSLIKPTAAKDSSESVRAVSYQKSVIPNLGPPTRPEEDILFQWRLRRKMEQAREWPQSLQRSSFHGSTLTWQTPSLTHPSASEQPYKEQHSSQLPQFSQRNARPHITAQHPETTEAHRLHPPDPSPQPFPAYVVPGSSVSQPQAIAHVPAHMHLLCDVLPCPIQPSDAAEKQRISQRPDETQTKPLHKKKQVPENSLNIISGVLVEHLSTSPHASHGAVEGQGCRHQKVPERDKKKKAETKELEKKTPLSTRQQKKSASLPKTIASWKEQRRQEGSQDFPSKSCTADDEPPPSPVHTTLGQVVSEVLFPAVDSPPAQTIPASSPLPPRTLSSHSQAQKSQDSVQVISLLLQEAEDSDEKEFEDDPLLQVLRQQKKWVKDQLSEVDAVLNNFPEDRRVT
ncbi:proline and serine-rich protein 3 isoform 2-T2 [Odontesthes bonariensis]|uniref:proline and serine-rich protein 3 isoform X2 n=1 Tax=Odontesthes bonariensis TaxID=219752 RepID=UPI003F583E4E